MLAGPVLVASALLGLAGVFKLARPVDTVGALRAAGLPASALAVRGLGLIEAVLAVAAVVTFERPVLLAVAAFYFAFAAFVAVALARNTPLQSCGCFGRLDTPPSAVHVVLDLTAGLVVVLAAVGDIPDLSATLSDQPWAGAPFLLLAATCTYLCVAALTVLPLTLRSSSSA